MCTLVQPFVDKLEENEWVIQHTFMYVESMVSPKFLLALITPHWKVLRAEICVVLLLLTRPFRWHAVMPKSNFSVFGQKVEKKF